MRDTAIIDTDKSNLQEARYAIEDDFKDLPNKDKLATANFLIEFLNHHIGKFCKELNSKHLKLTKHISYCERRVKKHIEKFMTI